jgi:hypothetical protein
MALYQQMIAPTERILRDLCASMPVPDMDGDQIHPSSSPTVVIASPFIFFGPPIAKELGLKWTTLIDTSVIGAIVTLKVAADAAPKSPEEAVLTGGVNVDQYMDVKHEDLVRVFGEGALTVKSPTVWLASGFKGLIDASDSLLVNTTASLDGELLPQLGDVFPVGPLFKHVPATLTGDLKCFLETQKPRSVVYIAMGTWAALSDKESDDLKAALAETKTPFIWVDSSQKVSRTSGVITPWAPQAAVLQHPSIGLFFSHGGWNSTIEALTGGGMLTFDHSVS